MPVIPILQRRQSISGEAASVPGNIGAAGLVGESVARAGRTGMAISDDFADLVARRNEELRKQNSAFAVLKAQNGMDKDVRAFRELYDTEAKQTAQDPASLTKFTDERVETFGKDLDTRYIADLTDADQKIHIEQYRNAAINRALDHTAVFQANFRKDFAKNQTTDAVSLALQSARDGEDPEVVRQTLQVKIGLLHTSGYLSENDTVEIFVKADQQLVVAYLDGMTARDPERAIKEIKSGKYSKYLPETDFRRLEDKAKTLVKAKAADAKAADAEARRVAKEALKAAQDETGNAFTAALLDGALTEADVIKSNLDPTGENSKQYWLWQLESRRKKSEALQDNWTENLFVDYLTEEKLTKDMILKSSLTPARKEHWIATLEYRQRLAEKTEKEKEEETKKLEKERQELEKEKKKQYDDRTENLFVNLLTEEKLTKDMVLKSNLTPARKEHWTDKLDQQKRLKEAETKKKDTERLKEAETKKKDTEWKTNPEVEAGLFARIVADPESVSDGEILDRVGEGLSVNTAKSLITKKREWQNKVDPARKAAEQAVLSNFKQDRDKGLFGPKNSEESRIEYAWQVQDFKIWSEKHPDDDPAEYYEKIMEPRKATFVETVLDWATGKFWDPKLVEPKKKREELRGGEQVPIKKKIGTRNGKPVYELPDGRWQVGD